MNWITPAIGQKIRTKNGLFTISAWWFNQDKVISLDITNDKTGKVSEWLIEDYKKKESEIEYLTK